jgi:hypothetical protein
LTSGEFQEWQLGLQLSMPLGYRRELSGIRHHELLLARDRAILQDLELEISHQLGDAIRDIDLNYGLTQTNFNRRVAAEAEVQAVQASYEVQRVTLDLLLDAQRRRAEAESAYYRSLVDYNRAIMNVHYRKGSLLEYDGVYLAEGPWPGKAYFDAMRQARKRDAAMYLDYGYTRPDVFSRGAYQQGPAGHQDSGGAYEIMEGEGPTPDVIRPEGETPQDEALPPPSMRQQVEEVPAESQSSVWRDGHEYQANHATAQADLFASVGAGQEFRWLGRIVWRRAADDLSRSRDVASGRRAVGV